MHKTWKSAILEGNFRGASIAKYAACFLVLNTKLDLEMKTILKSWSARSTTSHNSILKQPSSSEVCSI